MFIRFDDQKSANSAGWCKNNFEMSKLKFVWLFFLNLARFFSSFCSAKSYMIEVGSFCFVRTEYLGNFASLSDEKLLAGKFWKRILKEVKLQVPHSNSDLAKFVLQEFHCKAMSDYHEWHLHKEALILSSVFEEMQKDTMQHLVWSLHVTNHPIFCWSSS